MNAPAIPPFLRILLLIPLLCASAGCGSSIYQPSRFSSVSTDSEKEIDDADVEKAFHAKPQLGASIHVAYYAFDAEKVADFEALLKGLPGVASVYRIPPFMITGQRRFEAPGGTAKEIGLKKLRLFAARAHADVLFVLDHGHRADWSANGYVAFSPLLLPVFFTPFRDLEVKSYADALVVDTRNGYLYGHVADDEQDKDTRLTIYSDRDRELEDAQWLRVKAGLGARLRALLDAERSSAVHGAGG